MTTTWADSFPSVSGWTEDLHNGSITPSGTTVELRVPYPAAGRWDASNKEAVMLHRALSGLGLDTIAALLVFEVTFSTGTAIGAQDHVGICLYEDDQNALQIETNPLVPSARHGRAVANVFSIGSYDYPSSVPIVLQIVWNNTASADTTDQGDPIAAGEVISYWSDDGGSTWTLFDQRAMPVAPTDIMLYACTSSTTGSDIVAVFESVSVSIPHFTPSAPAPDPVVTPIHPGRPYNLMINDAGDLEVDDNGQLMRDYSVATRARIHLMCRRGEYWADPTMGSRFHLLKLLKDARAKVQSYAEEALEPLVRDGSIIGVEATDVEELVETGQLAARIAITVAEGEAVQLGLIPLGSIS